MIEIGIRAKFCCEYCGKDLLSDVDAYDSWQKDHIVPNGPDQVSNLAVSCKTCNFAKRRTDPSEGQSDSDRDALVEAAKVIIRERRQEKQRLLDLTVEAARVLMSESERKSGL